MDIDTLRYMVTLADELHFVRAAERHFVSAGYSGVGFSRRSVRWDAVCSIGRAAVYL